MQLTHMMSRSRDRCNQIAESERLMGYEDSADTYRQMAYEVAGLTLWLASEERRLAEEKRLERLAVYGRLPDDNQPQTS